MADRVDFAATVGALIKGARYARPTDTTVTDVNNYVTEGFYPVTRSGVPNRPIGASGDLEVFPPINGNVVQEWTTHETEPRKFLRYRNSATGVWSAWVSGTWRGNNITSSDNLDNVLTAAYYQVSNAATVGKPTAGVGVLEVYPVGPSIVQRFTSLETVPRQFTRSRIGAVWSAWAETAGTGQITTLQTQVDSVSKAVPTRSQVGTWEPTLTAKNQASYVAALSNDRLTGWNGNSSGLLQETRDLGATWQPLRTFASSVAWVRQAADGELLVCVGVGTAPRELWRSTGYPSTGAGATWTKVLTASAPSVTFTASWGFSQHKNIVLVNEYGPKYGTGDVVEGQNARYSYMSLDHGKTWRTIFDLNNYLSGVQGRTVTTGTHLHGVAWDPYWDRIWLTFGDDVNGTVYSDDLGATWQTAYYGSSASSPNQVVGILPMPKCILFGTDTAPNGVVRIDRSEGKRGGTYPHIQAYTIPGDDGVTRTHLCHSIYRVARPGDDGPAIIGFSAESTAAPSLIVVTYDGYEFRLLWKDSQSQPAGKGLRSIAGPTLTGELIVGSDDQREASMWSVWRGPAPIY